MLKEGMMDVFGLYSRRKKEQKPHAGPPIPDIPLSPIILLRTKDVGQTTPPDWPLPEEQVAMLKAIQKQLNAVNDGNSTLDTLWGLKKIFPYLDLSLPDEYLWEVKKTLDKNEKRYKKLEDWVQNRDRHWSEIESIKQMIDDQVVDAMDSAKQTEEKFRYTESSDLDYYYGPRNSKVLKLTSYDGIMGPRGAFGEIEYGLYYYEDENWPRRAVVMKRLIVSDFQRTGLRRKVEREAAIWSSFQHENVVEFLGLFKAREVLGNTLLEQKGELYLVSPFSRLKTIDEHSANLYVSKHRGDFPLIMDNVIDGLHYLHIDKFFRHGDLKGDNIIVFLEDGVISAKLTDFGLSSSATEKNLRSTIVGSRTRWAPPEYLQSEEPHELTYAGDIWSLTMTTQECTPIHSESIPFFDIPVKVADKVFYTFMEKSPESEFESKMQHYVSLFPLCLHGVLPPVWKRNPDLRPTISTIRQRWKSQYSQLMEQWPGFNPCIDTDSRG